MQKHFKADGGRKVRKASPLVDSPHASKEVMMASSLTVGDPAGLSSMVSLLLPQCDSARQPTKPPYSGLRHHVSSTVR